VLISAGRGPGTATTAACPDSAVSDTPWNVPGITGRVRLQVPPGRRIRSTARWHVVLEAGKQDSAQSQPPALPVATTGSGGGCRAQVIPSSRVA
jgi:hypothetical protein